MSQLAEAIRADLIRNSDEATRNSGERFFKEDIKLHGTKTAVVTKIGKEHLKKNPGLSKAEVFALCEELWASGYLEESGVACIWAHSLHKDFEPGDFEVFESWVANYVSNWAACDTLCNHTIGTFIEMYAEYISRLKEWATSDNRWMRRASAVSLIVPAKRGKFLPDILEIADILLLDDDDLVRKGYGWMLKEASRQHQQEVFDYVVRNKRVMPRTSLRYAIEKMPPEMKKEAMAK